MNDNAECLPNRVAYIAGKHRSHFNRVSLLERGLPAKSAKAVCLSNRVANIAGKRAPTGSVIVCACQTEASDSRASLAATGDAVFCGSGACPR